MYQSLGPNVKCMKCVTRLDELNAPHKYTCTSRFRKRNSILAYTHIKKQYAYPTEMYFTKLRSILFIHSFTKLKHTPINVNNVM